MLRKLFGARRDNMLGEWEKLHNSELHALYSSSSIIRSLKFEMTEMGRTCSTRGAIQKCIQVL